MSNKSYLEIEKYQARNIKRKQIITEHMFDPALVKKYIANLHPGKLSLFAKERGIPEDVLRSHEIGWDGYAYTIPIYHYDGFLIGFRRKIPGGDTISKKGSCAGLFNVKVLRKSASRDAIYICEGCWDAMALEAQGYRNIVAVPGAYTFLTEWVPYFKDRHVVILYDADETGRARAMKVADMLLNIAMSVKNVDLSKILHGGKDVRDYFCKR